MNYLKKHTVEIMGLFIIPTLIGLILGFTVTMNQMDKLENIYLNSPEVPSVEEEAVLPTSCAELEPPEDVISEPEFVFIPMCDLDEDIQRTVFRIANEYDIAYTLVLSIIVTESRCDPSVISKTGDYGLMQINKLNHRWMKEALGITDIMDIEQNIRSGCFILSVLKEDYGDSVDKVLMCYNLGESKSKMLWNQGIYETKYSKEITQREMEFSKYIDERVNEND